MLITALAPISVLHHSVERLAPGILEQLGVLLDLAADERSQRRREVPGEATAADDEPEDLAAHLPHAVTGHEGRGDDDHGRIIPLARRTTGRARHSPGGINSVTRSLITAGSGTRT